MSVLGSAAKSASYNMILQLLFRMLTFILNAFILRHISKEMLGVVNVRLTLLYSTIIFVTREAFRKACLSKTEDKQWSQVINLLWLTVPVGILCSVIFVTIWCFLLELPNPERIPFYNVAVICFAGSCLIEILTEPLWVVGQAFLFVKLKVIIEGCAIATRCIITVTMVSFMPQLGLIGFSIAQLIYTAVFLVLYYSYFFHYINSTKLNERPAHFPLNSVGDFFPHRNKNQAWFGMGMVHLTWSFFKQSVLKQLLTEGERYAMTVFNILNFGDQGVYDVINNLGSLVARFVFYPIEDSCYLFFSQTLTRDIPHAEQNKAITLAAQVLENLLKTMGLIGFTFATFGYAYSYLLLHIYGGTILSSGTGPLLLKWFCLYVFLISVNGTSEGFVFAAMSKCDVDRYNQKMFLFSVLFLMSSYYLAKMFGAVGFILANCLNMIARITHSIFFIHRYMKGISHHPLTGLIPSIPVLVAYLAAFVITALSERLFCCNKGLVGQIVHVAVGGACLIVVLVTIYLTEQNLVKFIKEQYKKSKQTKAE